MARKRPLGLYGGTEAEIPDADTIVGGRISLTGGTAIGDYADSNSGLLGSTTNLNPGYLVYSNPASTKNSYGIDLGYDGAAFGTRMFAPDDKSIQISFVNAAPTAQSHFTNVLKITLTAFAFSIVGTISTTVTGGPGLIVTTTGSAYGIGIYSLNVGSGSRNWAAITNDTAWGDFGIKQSTAEGGNPFSAGAYRFRLTATQTFIYGKLNFVTTPPNFANDAAAAAGGVVVGEVYRNGSILMVRVV